MGVVSFVHWLREAVTYGPLKQGLLDPVEERQQRFHRRLAIVSTLCGVIGLGFGVAGAVVYCLREEAIAFRLRAVIGLPLLCGASGFFFGMGMMCLFAPRAFLQGPQGRKWMKLIGTKSVLAARAACLAFVLLLIALVTVVGLILTYAK